MLEVDGRRYLTESNAILWYLAEGSPLLPADSLERAGIVRWLILEQTDVMPGIGGLRFRLVTGRLAANDPEAVRRRGLGRDALAMIENAVGGRRFLVGDRFTIADIAVYAYAHTAPEAGFDLGEFPAVVDWLTRVESQPRFVNDLEPYPDNARPGRGRSTYD